MREMSNEKLEVVRGKGPSVFHDHGDPDADSKALKAQLAAEILAALNQRKLTARAAEKVTGVTAGDITRIRNADLGRFTIDRLVRVLARLDRKVEVTVKKIPGTAVA